MCIAAPGIVKSIKGREAVIEYAGFIQKAMVGISELKAGDSVLVQMGIIVKKIDNNESRSRQEVWQE